MPLTQAQHAAAETLSDEDLVGLARGRDEAAVRLMAADELDFVREVGAEQRVLASGGGRDPLAGDAAFRGEDGVEAGGGEGRVPVSALEIVPLDRVSQHDPDNDQTSQKAAGDLPPRQVPT